MRKLLETVPFRNPSRARADVEALASGIGERLQPLLRNLVASMPEPDEALHRLREFRERHPGAFDRVAVSPALLRYLAATFAYSSFLSEAVLRHPEWILQLGSSGTMHRTLSAEEYRDSLENALGTENSGAPPPLALAHFRRRQLLRIVLRDVLGLAMLPEITEELSNLADAILDVVYTRIREEIAARHGEPLCADTGEPAGFSILSLGKHGGKELNYSSDIDLMFVYGGAGQTAGAAPLDNREFFKKVANQCTELLSVYTAEGMCYRVDLRLRPDGRLGEVCVSLDGARQYYAKRARDWELQMLIKARVSAGDRAPGAALLEFVEPRIYETTLNFRAVEAVSEARQRIGEKLAQKRPAQGGLDIKLTKGGIRDIEFLVQCLQRLHGGREPWVRHGGTLFALSRLRDKDLLSGSEYARLAAAYQFLRHLEHRLQFECDRQTHSLPRDPDDLETLARRMPPGATGESYNAATLERELHAHLGAVRELYDRVIVAQRPAYYTALPDPGELPAVPLPEPPSAAAPASNLARFLDQRTRDLADAVGRTQRGRARFEAFLERLMADPPLLARFRHDAELVECALDLFEHSPYFADQLIRSPEMVCDLEREPETDLDAAHVSDAAGLRRFYRERMIRIQSDSVFRRAPIFPTLERTSDLADAVIATAYRIALRERSVSHPPAGAAYRPEQQLMVIALGRLGMREFDIASDADLVFVLPEADAAELPFWTGVAERAIDLMSAYTGEGVMFTVDTRLRPNGREGPLVQIDSAVKDYFAGKAEAWEGITYMKSRGVAGDIERATAFLRELQDIDWLRYGRTARSRKELAQMRARLEKEQGGRNPLKAGAGGYYDIDFVLMYLRLKGAGVFYKHLNTPARIEVLEKLGNLDIEDAEFFRDAATLYRSIDHGLRVSGGHAEGSLPQSAGQLEVLTELVRRWTPEHLHDEPLYDELAQIRRGTRERFNRIFGV